MTQMIGKVLSHFRILERIDAGGMGVVFLIAFAMLNYRVIDIPGESADLSIYPWGMR